MADERVAEVLARGTVYPPGEHAVIEAVGLQPAPEAVAQALKIPPGASAVMRARTRYRGDKAVEESTSWFHPDAQHLQRLMSTASITEGTFAYVAAETGREVGTWDTSEDGNTTIHVIKDTDGGVIEYAVSKQI